MCTTTAYIAFEFHFTYNSVFFTSWSFRYITAQKICYQYNFIVFSLLLVKKVSKNVPKSLCNAFKKWIRATWAESVVRENLTEQWLGVMKNVDWLLKSYDFITRDSWIGNKLFRSAQLQIPNVLLVVMRWGPWSQIDFRAQ